MRRSWINNRREVSEPPVGGGLPPMGHAATLDVYVNLPVA